jgi:hypothetical protein
VISARDLEEGSAPFSISKAKRRPNGFERRIEDEKQ